VRKANVVVEVQNGNVDGALKLLKKQMGKIGLLALLKNQSPLFAYVKPSMRRNRRRRLAGRRTRRQMLRQQRHHDWIDGVLPPREKVRAA
jgi:ribosomal protein S21